MGAERIPIANIYYLLCYAWDVLDEAKLASVSIRPEMKLQDLLASILRGAVTHLLKRGLDRAYATDEGEIAGVRGRIDIGTSLKRISFPRARAYCVFDELSADVLHNRIVKTTLRQLAQVGDLDSRIASELRDLYRRMPGVQEMSITGQAFSRITLGRNNAYYRFALDVCEIVHRNLLAHEGGGQSTFRDFTRDDRQMAKLFERFLFNFYRREQRHYQVAAPRFKWRATGADEDLAYLPEMRTDIVLRDANHLIVIDAKYYSATLTEHFNRATVHPSNLYQIFTYMSHLSGSEHGQVAGMLIYPRVTRGVQVRLNLFGHEFLAVTLNLDQSWTGVRDDLLGLMEAMSSRPRPGIEEQTSRVVMSHPSV